MLDSGMALTKGIGFLNVRSFVRERFGDAAWDRVCASLTAADLATVLAVAGVGWYDLNVYARLIRGVDAGCGAGDLRLLSDLGRYEAEKDMNVLYRVLLRVASPALIVEKTGAFWNRFHDTGKWEVERGDNRVTGVLSDWGVVDAALCNETLHYMARLLELVGAKEVHGAHPRCRAQGQETCKFEMSWR